MEQKDMHAPYTAAENEIGTPAVRKAIYENRVRTEKWIRNLCVALVLTVLFALASTVVSYALVVRTFENARFAEKLTIQLSTTTPVATIAPTAIPTVAKTPEPIQVATKRYAIRFHSDAVRGGKRGGSFDVRWEIVMDLSGPYAGIEVAQQAADEKSANVISACAGDGTLDFHYGGVYVSGPYVGSDYDHVVADNCWDALNKAGVNVPPALPKRYVLVASADTSDSGKHFVWQVRSAQNGEVGATVSKRSPIS